MIKSTLTDKWQTTIPAKVRKALHLKPRQRLVYELVEGAVLVKPDQETLNDLYGVLADGKDPVTKSKERELTRKVKATRYLPGNTCLCGNGG